jgi:RNA polymerase sigma-70 factor, ECF subfamily
MLLQEILNGHNKVVESSGFAQTTPDDRKGLGTPQVTPLGEDASWVERLRSGDEQAFEEMVRKFGGRLLATARRYSLAEDDARDALQDAFLCAFKSIGEFKGNSQFLTWLHRIVINSALMHLRARRRRPDSAGVEVDELLPHFDRAGHWTDERTCTMPPYVFLEISETKIVVQRCIARLPHAYRLVVTLRYIDELNTEEVASLLGLSPNNVKVRLHRARQALKALIERERTL